MDSEHETKAIRDFVNAFSEALSTSNNKIISSYYATDGLFLPNNYPTIAKDQLDKSKSKFLKNRKFEIHYEINEIVFKDNLVFVQAIANATTSTLANNDSVTVATRDFFTLCKENDEWKIYRYMFNDFKATLLST